MKIKIAAAGIGAVVGVLAGVPVAHADTNSYLDYYHSHGGMPWPEFGLIQGGYQACSTLRAGASREDVIRTANGYFPGMFDVATDAAQHELCPDTLR